MKPFPYQQYNGNDHYHDKVEMESWVKNDALRKEKMNQQSKRYGY